MLEPQHHGLVELGGAQLGSELAAALPSQGPVSRGSSGPGLVPATLLCHPLSLMSQGRASSTVAHGVGASVLPAGLTADRPL